MILLIFLAWSHARAESWSIGQGRFLALYCAMPAIVSITPAPIKSAVLCSDNQMSPGAAETRPANVAPIPSVTNSAGSAQQTSVLAEVKRLKNEARRVALKFIIYFLSIFSTV